MSAVQKSGVLPGLFIIVVLCGLALLLSSVTGQASATTPIVTPLEQQVGTGQIGGIQYQIVAPVIPYEKVHAPVFFLVKGTDDVLYEVKATFSISGKPRTGSQFDFDHLGRTSIGPRDFTTMEEMVEKKMIWWLLPHLKFYVLSEDEKFDVSNIEEVWGKNATLRHAILDRLQRGLILDSYYECNVHWGRDAELSDIKLIGKYVAPFVGG